MANIDKAFDVELISLNDTVLIVQGSFDPSTIGYEAERGSLFLQTTPATGKLFLKTGNLDTDWTEVRDVLSKVSSNDTTAGYLANKIVAGSGITVVETNDGGNETLTINSTVAPAGGDLAGVVAGLNASVNIPTTYTNINWTTTHIQNDTLVVEHSSTNPDRILIKETGMYFIGFSISFDADAGEEQISCRVLKNNSTLVPGSERIATEDDEINDLSNFFIASLNAGDYLTVQITASGTGNVLHYSSNCSVVRARGSQGLQGPPGSGSTIEVQDSGVNLANTPHSTLNFEQFNVTDQGGGIAKIQPIFGSEFYQVESEGVTTTTSTTYIEKVALSTGSLPAGKYRIGWFYQWNHNSVTSDFVAQIRLNGTELYRHKQEPKDAAGSFSTTLTSQRYMTSGFTYEDLSGNNTIQIRFKTDTSTDESSMWGAKIELWRVS